MATIAAIDPVTRLEGHLKVEVSIDTVNGVQKVVDAKATGTLFRGFESILVGRTPTDAQHITERICGVCPVSHGMAAVLAMDTAAKVNIPANARIMRNLVLGANFLQSHILHFYHLTLPDYITGPAMPPWTPSWSSDRRLDATASAPFVANYLTALDMRRKAHEMGALFGGRMPHPPSFVTGGIASTAQAARITKYIAYLNELIPFITNVYIPDVKKIAALYSDYKAIGAGVGNLLAFGVFDQDNAGATKLLKRGRIVKGTTGVQPVDTSYIKEQVGYSWYADTTNNLSPVVGVTTPQNPKTNAYSWLKAPRYLNKPYETGALARMKVNGDYTGGISVMDRHLARAAEALKVANALMVWVKSLTAGGAVYTTPTLPAAGRSFGLTEAPRGALGHWVEYKAGVISRYQIITPTCWNASPRDSAGVRGPIEEALIGTPVLNINEPIEVVRVIHSFDPCLSCAVHVMSPTEEAKIVTLEHYHSGEEVYSHDHGDGHVHSHTHGDAK
ncbi:MAG: nickel-dependent hydrogenase large subunit [bacterium]